MSHCESIRLEQCDLIDSHENVRAHLELELRNIKDVTTCEEIPYSGVEDDPECGVKAGDTVRVKRITVDGHIARSVLAMPSPFAAVKFVHQACFHYLTVRTLTGLSILHIPRRADLRKQCWMVGGNSTSLQSFVTLCRTDPYSLTSDHGS